MTKRMLIDATHEEETRVAVVDGNRLADYDYESKVRKQLKGSVFLAKVTRVEPSLQAAFVNFGGNRHGFLPFSEIHPDYFRIPIADREAILAEQRAEMEARQAAEEAEDEEEDDELEGSLSEMSDEGHEEDHDDDHEEDEIEELGGEGAVAGVGDDVLVAGPDVVMDEEAEADVNVIAGDDASEGGRTAQSETDEAAIEQDGAETASLEEAVESLAGHEEREEYGREGRRGGRRDGRRGRGRGRGRGHRVASDSRRVEIVGGDGVEGDRPVRPSLRRDYKIQEVIKRGQIMLVQVSKEERGNKGAAVTTYLSLPGRYCVLMPNSPRGGGVSRKIANFKDRRRMRDLLKELKVPEGMSVIMRTAGVERTKTEVKRDLDYLMRLWDSMRELTLQSTAPALIHEESNLIRRAIRDIYAKDIEEVIVSGDEGHRIAKDFMKMMIPSHVKKVKHYKEEKIPLFQRYQVESQINEMGNPVVTLPSGGYLVINPTEALVAIDVNSGRATRERHIEETALKTNMEAASEVSRQLRLRDLGGLIVVDFIDMEDRRNNRKVENRIKEALSSDRARIQIGRISSFGLMELSRQRLNPSLTDAQFRQCAHCKGMGYTRTVDSAAILAIRALEEEGIKARSSEVFLYVPHEVALYILNQKRDMLVENERRYGFTVEVRVDEALAPSGFRIEGNRSVTKEDDDDAHDEGEDKGGEETHEGEKRDQGRGVRRRGRRGGRRRGGRFQDRDGEGRNFAESEEDDTGTAGGDEPEGAADVPAQSLESEEKPKRGRGRGRGRPAAKDVARDEVSAEKPKAKKDETKKEEKAKEEKGDDRKKSSGSKKADGEGAELAFDKKTEVAAVSAAPSNDVPPPPKDYEKVNEAPAQKKKGWWNRLAE